MASQAPTLNLWPRSRALLCSALVMSISLGALFVGKEVTAPEVFTVRKVSVGLPPPPPPPPNPVETAQTEQDVAIDLLAGLDHGTPLLNVQVAPVAMKTIEMPRPDLSADLPQLDSNLSFNWDGFGLSELDTTPQLLTPLKVRFPNSLLVRGIKRVSIEVTVLIDTDGQVFLKEILTNPHPELTSRIESVMQRARFTPPRKDGEKVRALFIWPIEFRDE